MKLVFLAKFCGYGTGIDYEMQKKIVFWIEEQPTIEPKRGRWENGICTSCGFDLRELTDGENDLEQWVWDEGLDFCPNCGAKMDGGEDDDT